MVSSVALLMATIMLASFMSNCEGCALAEEGRYFHLFFQPDEKFNWTDFRVDSGNGYQEMTRCFTNKTCYTNDPNFTEFLVYNRTTQLFSVVLEMKAAERKYANWSSVWEDIYGMNHTTQPCNLTVYVLPDSPACDDPVFVNSSMILTCRTDRVYPTAKCRLINYSPLYIHPTVNYSIQTSPISPDDYSVTCTFIWKLPSVIQQTTLTFAVAMSPVKSIEVMTPNISVDLSYPSTDLGKDCPDVIMAGTTATCTCLLATVGSPPGKAFWYSQDETVNVIDKGDGSSQLELKFNSSVPNPVFYCSSKSDILQEPDSKAYIPRFVYISGQVNLQIKGYPEVDLCTEVLITCLVTVHQLNTGCTSYLTINDQQLGNHTSLDDDVSYQLRYTFKPKWSGQYQIGCEVRNNLGNTLVAKDQNTLTVTGTSCDDKGSGNFLNYILGGCVGALFLILVVIIIILYKFYLKHKPSTKTDPERTQQLLADDRSIDDNVPSVPHPPSSTSSDLLFSQATPVRPFYDYNENLNRQQTELKLGNDQPQNANNLNI